MSEIPPVSAAPLENIAAEVERHVGSTGWDQPPQIFALVDTAELLRTQPGLADSVGAGIDVMPDGSLTPVEQEPLPDAPLDETLGRIAWPEGVRGCALVHEIVVLPPGAEEAMPADADAAEYA
ncbi:MAG TPA: PPA1309 family protein, partial [Mycobacteriales bacterium]